jgi:hypothetical protein
MDNSSPVNTLSAAGPAVHREEVNPAALLEALRASIASGQLPRQPEFRKISARAGSRGACAGCGLVIEDDEIIGERPNGGVIRLHALCLLAWLAAAQPRG